MKKKRGFYFWHEWLIIILAAVCLLLIFVSFDQRSQVSEIKKSYQEILSFYQKLCRVDSLYTPENLYKLIEDQIVFGDETYQLDENLKVDIVDQMIFLIRRGEVENWISNMGLYQGICDSIFVKNGLPKKIWLIARHESGFKFDAKSYARAIGLYQLMTSVAKKYNGSIIWQNGRIIYDERLDFEISAKIAAKYISFLRGKVENWPESFLAYNMGLYGFKRKKKQQKTSFDFMYLNSETARYYIRYLAFYFINKNAEYLRLNSRKKKILEWDNISFILTKNFIELSQVMNWCGTKNYKLIYILNARFADGKIHRKINGQIKKWAIRLPKGTKNIFINNFKQNKAGILSEKPSII